MGKSKAQLAKEARWNPSVARIIAQAMNGTADEALSLMGVAVRSAESTIDRLTFFSKKVREQILMVMLGNSLDEFRASRRTFLRIDNVFTIKKNQAGRETVKELTARFGGKMTKQLVQSRFVTIPQHVEEAFEINEEYLASLDSQTRLEIAKVIGNVPKLYIGDVPKRVKTGQPRRRREARATRKR